MHIWILNHYAVPPSGCWGTRHATLSRYLQEAGHTVTILPGSAQLEGPRPTVEIAGKSRYLDQIHDGVRYRYVRTPTYSGLTGRLINNLIYGRNVCKAVDSLLKPDVVIGSSVHLHAANAGLRLALRYRVPFVFEVRDIWPETLLSMGAITRRHPAYWYFRRMELQMYRNAQMVIGLFPGVWSYLEKQGVQSSRFLYLPNGIAPDLFPRLPYPLDRGVFTITFFGSHAPSDGLENVVRAAAVLSARPEGATVRLRLVGDGVSKAGLQQMAAHLGLRNMEFLPPVPKTDLVRYAQDSHAFLYSHAYMPVVEKYGLSANKLFDYLLLARPVVFACKSYNDPIREARAGISVPPNDPEALAAAIVGLKSIPVEERERMGQRGRVWVLENHSMEGLARQLEERLDQLVVLSRGSSNLRGCRI